MKRAGVLILAALVAWSAAGCDTVGPIIGDLQNDTENAVQQETQQGDGLIEEVGDIMIGLESETELDVIVPDEDATEIMTETAVAETGQPGSEQAVTEQPVTEVPAETETETETEKAMGPLERPLKELIGAREAMGEHWALAYEDLETGEIYGYHEEDVLQSASVVKLFIMGAVYRYMCYPSEGEEVIPFHEDYDGQLRDTIVSMITVSDNDCANLLIDRLGEGDFHLGAQRIADFCKEYGYTGTSVGRHFLESNPSGDNYTTAADTRKFLSDLYHGTLINAEASEKMLTIVKGQTRKNKIPAGLPAGFTSGNKTGEMPEGYGLGCIENDSAIVFPPEGEGQGYILTVMSTNLGGRNSEAINTIVQVSSMVAQWYLEH